MIDGSDDVALGDMRDLVGQHRREFAFGFRREDHSGVDADESSRRGERVQRLVLDHEEREPEIAVIGGGSEPVAQRLDVLLDQGIVDQGESRADGAHERFSECALVGGRERRLRRVAEIGELHLRLRSAGNACHCPHHRKQHEARS